MKRLGILSLRWATAAVVGALLLQPQVLRAQGAAQGIKVHGHWVIEVRNADGSLHIRREFDNALLASGKQTLAEVLIGQRAMGLWRVTAEAGSALCTTGGNLNSNCSMVESTSPFAEDYRTFKNLTKTLTAASELVLHGSFVATNSASITFVATEVSPPGTFFTERQLDTPIPVEATQTVSVTVTFTFS